MGHKFLRVEFLESLGCKIQWQFEFHIESAILTRSIPVQDFQGGTPTPKGVCQPIILQNFCRKLLQ